jgi:adenylate cyclase
MPVVNASPVVRLQGSTSMSDNWAIRIEEDNQTAFEVVCGAPLELGRQNPGNGEALYRVSIKPDGGYRLAIARNEEVSVSRRQTRIETLPDGRVQIKNISTNVPFSLGNGRVVKQGTDVVIELPALLRFGKRSVHLQDAEVGDTGGPIQGLAEPTQTPDISGSRGSPLSALDLHSGVAFDAEAVIRWLRATMGVLHSAASDSDFYQKAAQAAVEVVSLDSGRVATRDRQGEWTTVASHPLLGALHGPEDATSRQILKMVCQHKRTFWYDPLNHIASYDASRLTDAGSSLAGVQSVVAAPILDLEGRVIAVLYGERRLDSIVNTGKRVTKLDAMLVELLAGSVAAGLARVENERKALAMQTQFEQFFTLKLARLLATQPDLLDGKDVEITALFCDIRGFSRITRNHGPKFTFEWIKDVLSTLSDCVLKHEGVLVDYIGDELMAMWGAPENQPGHAECACRAALEMIGCLPAINQRWEAPLGEAMGLGIGIDTGIARVGNTGSKLKFKYGPLGDTVNVASRVQGASKYFRSSLLITRSTRDRLGPEFQVRRLGTARVVNIADPIELFELCSPDQPGVCELSSAYEQALGEFEAREFRKAARTLGRIINSHADDGPSIALLARAVACIVEEPVTFDPAFRLAGK